MAAHPRIRLYAFDGSNACVSTRLLLEHVGLEYEWVAMKPGLHPFTLKARRFPAITAPAVDIDGRKLNGSRRIARLVAEELAPDAGLLPEDTGEREQVLEAERMGERLQNAVRRMVYNAAKHDRHSVRRLVDANYASWPAPARGAMARVLVPMASVGHGAKTSRVASDLARVVSILEQADELAEAGLLGREPFNVADFQLAPNIIALGEVRGRMGELVRDRPAWHAARAVLTEYPLDFEMRFPDAWDAYLT